MSNKELSWFDIDNYKKVKDFTLADWHFQLSRRIGFRTFSRKFIMAYFDDLAYVGRGFPKNTDIEGRLTYIWDKIKENPILAPPEITPIDTDGKPILDFSLEHHFNRIAVKPATLNDLPRDLEGADF